MLAVVRGAEVYSPQPMGFKDVVLAAGKICGVRDAIDLRTDLQVTEIDARGKLLLPGFIDNHVHITGGGGENGFGSRTPEITLDDIIVGGVTTVVGTLGTDGTTRTMASLLAKAHELEAAGITTYCQTGSYQIPVRTVTGSVTDDIVLLEKVIGVGEIAVSDHRSSCPTWPELARVASQARIGGMLSGKAGTVNLHIGDSPKLLEPLEAVLAHTDIPIRHFVPTHMNRNPALFEKAMAYLKKGGNADFTTSTVSRFLEEGEVAAGKTLKRLLAAGVPTNRVTLSSDGQGSLPLFGPGGETVGMDVGRVASLFEAVRQAVLEDHVPMEIALATITANVADVFCLTQKGHIREGYDADVVLVDREHLAIDTVIAKGQVMLRRTP